MNSLLRILKLQQGEGLKVLQFAALNALVHGGIGIGIALTDALFLSEIGVAQLPYVYLFTPVIMLMYVPLFARFVRRWGAERAFIGTLLFLILGGVWLYFASSTSVSPVVFFSAKFFSILAGIALYTIFWTFTDSFFDIQDGKRLFALFSAGGAVGAIAGGVLVSIVSEAGFVEPLFLAWSALGAATIPLIVLIGRSHEQLEEEGEEPGAGGAKEKRKVGSYLPLFAAAVVLILVLAAIAEYQYLSIFSASAGKAELSALLGRLYAVAGGLNLVINLFLFNRMVLTFGVPAVAGVTPIAFLIGFTYLLAAPGMASAVVAFLVVQSILESIDLNNQNFLFNAFPGDLKKQIRTFFEGLGEPIATALGGAFLLFAVSRMSPPQLSTVGIGLSALALLVVMLLRGGYLRSMVRNLKESWLDLSQPSHALLTGLSSGELASVRARVSSAAELSNIHAAIRILWLNDRELATDALLDFMGRADAGQLVESRSLLSLILEEKDSEVVRRILYWVSEYRERLDPEFLEELGYHGLLQSREVAHLFDSEEPAELGAAVVTAWHSWRPEDRLQAMQTLDRLVQGGESFVEVGVRATGQLGQESLAHFIVPYLHHADARVQKQAIHALRRTVNENSNRLVPEILNFLQLGEEEDRLAGLEALAKIGDTASIAPLLRASGDLTPQERRAAERVLLRIGLKSVPTVVSVLRDPGSPYPGRALAARALGKLALPQLEALADTLIRTEIAQAYRFLHYHERLESGARPTPGVQVLSQHYRDLRRRIVDFILEILTIGGRLPDFELISSSLGSQNPKERGNAIETIEQGVPRGVFRQLLPLIDGRSTGEMVAFFRANFAAAESAPDAILARALESAFPIECAAAAQALWEQGAPGTAERLRARLTAAAPAVLRETIVALSGGTGPDRELNPIERLHLLSRCDLLDRLRVSELELLSRFSELRRYSEGELILLAGSPAAELHVIVEGSVEVHGGPGPELRRAGEAIGEEGVFGVGSYAVDAISGGASTLVLQVESVLEAIRTYPSIGVEIYRHRMRMEDAATV